VFLNSINPTFGIGLLSGMLAAMLTRPAAALMSALHVHLFTAGPSPITYSATIAGFTEATFGGYAAVTLASLTGPVLSPSGTCDALYNNASFVASSAATPNTILGYWCDDGAANWFMGEYFQSPVPIVAIGDFIDLAVIFGLDFKPEL
jgi:hypothetical protein